MLEKTKQKPSSSGGFNWCSLGGDFQNRQAGERGLGWGHFGKKSKERSRASHVITVPSIKTALTGGLAELQKFESLGVGGGCKMQFSLK